MSKGKRKSLPGAIAIIRQKLRTRTLTQEDRGTLQQCSRLDLIALIERETGTRLSGARKNSVAAMIEWLLGPENTGASSRQRSRSHVFKKKTRLNHTAAARVGKGPRFPAAAAAAGTKPKQEPSQTASAPLAEVKRSDNSWRYGWQEPKFEASLQHALSGQLAYTSGCPVHGGPTDALKPAAEKYAAESEHWLQDLQMQLAAAAAAAAAADDTDDIDVTGTAQSAMRVPAVLGSAETLHPQHQGMVYSSQVPQSQAITDDELESRLLQQLLQDMQLGSDQQQQQQMPAVPQHHTPQVQPHLAPQLLQSSYQPQPLQAPETQEQQIHTQHQLSFAQHTVHGPTSQELHQQQQQQQAGGDQQLNMLQLQPIRSSSMHNMDGFGQAEVYSCPLPRTCSTHSVLLPSLTHTPEGMLQPTAYGLKSLSSSLPVWQQQSEVTESASMTLKKRDRQQLFQHLMTGSGPCDAMTVELSGPSADLTIKRRSLQVPGTGSFTAVASAFAGNAFEARSARSAPPRLAPPFLADLAADKHQQQLRKQQQPERQQQNAQQHDRSGLKQGMKGLAKRFKQLLGGKRSNVCNKQQQQREEEQTIQNVAQQLGSFAGRAASSASAPAVVRQHSEAVLDVLSEIDADYAAEGLLPPSRQLSSVSAPTTSVVVAAGVTGGQSLWSPGITASQRHSCGSSLNSLPGTTHGGTSVGSASNAGTDDFGTKLRLLRAMSSPHYDLSSQHAAAGAAVPGSGNMPSSLHGGTNNEPTLPALVEEADAAQATAMAAAATLPEGKAVPFMQKLGKAFGLVRKEPNDVEAAAAAAGLSVTERSNSSFSLFLAQVASGWRHDGSNAANMPAAAATYHEDSYPPSAVGQGSFSTTVQASSFSHSVHPSLGSYGVNRSSFSHSVHPSNSSRASLLRSGQWGSQVIDRSSFSQSVGISLPSMLTDRSSSFGPLITPSLGSIGGVADGSGLLAHFQGSTAGAGSAAAAMPQAAHSHHAPAADAAAAASIQPHGDLLGPVHNNSVGAGLATTPQQQPLAHANQLHGNTHQSNTPCEMYIGAAAASGMPHSAEGVEHSRASFSRLFGPCAGSGPAAAGPQTVEHSRSSFSKLLGSCLGSEAPGGSAAAMAAARGSHGVEHSLSSFDRLFGRASASTADGSGSDGSGLGSKVEHSRSSFSRLLGPCTGSDAGASAAAGAHGTDHRRKSSRGLVEKSSNSFSKLFGLCAGCDLGAGSIAADSTAEHDLFAVQRSSKSLQCYALGGGMSAPPAAAAAAAEQDSIVVQRSSRSFQGVEKGANSFTKLFGPCTGHTAGADAATVEGSSNSFTRMFGFCIGGDAAPGIAGEDRALGDLGVAKSSGSFSRGLGVGAGMTVAGLVEDSSRSCSRTKFPSSESIAANAAVPATAPPLATAAFDPIAAIIDSDAAAAALTCSELPDVQYVQGRCEQQEAEAAQHNASIEAQEQQQPELQLQLGMHVQHQAVLPTVPECTQAASDAATAVGSGGDLAALPIATDLLKATDDWMI